MKQAKIISLLKNSIVVLVIIIILSTIQTYTLHQTKKFGSVDFYDIDGHIFSIIISIISFLSTYLSWKIISKIYTQRIIKIGMTFLLALLIFSIMVSVYYVLYRYLIYNFSTSINMIIGNIVFGITMNHLYISGYTIAYLHFSNSKKLAVNIEHLEKEKEVFKSKMLQKNLEPHFLFNNLSILSSLIKKKPDEVETFIDNFSDVYRYYLKHNQKEIVTLSEEIKFIKSYILLIQKRFNNAYTIHIKIENELGYILPCSLQLCIENAIKHNYGNENNPLEVYLERIEDTIIIKNKLKPIETNTSSYIGNQYLKDQYKLLFNCTLEFEKTETEYFVRIPIIK